MARPALEVADILRDHGPAWREANRGHVSLDQLKVMSAIERCRTVALGGHVARCENEACGHTLIAYNSCRNRHCPKCQGAASRRWLADREAELLPVQYFHVVYTLPSELRDIAYQNKRVIYDLLMKAAAETTLAIATDPKRLGARIGVTAVLHTWGSALTHHPHVHMIVPGGGLSLDGARWVGSRSNFLVHVNVLARLFRGKMLAMLMDAHDAGQLTFFNTHAGLADKRTFKRFIAPLRHIKWVVYARHRSRARAGAALSLPLYASCRHLQPPPRCSRRRRHRVPLEGLSHQRPGPLEDNAASPARIHQALPAARVTQGLPPHPPLRALRQRQPRREYRDGPRTARCRPACRRPGKAARCRAGRPTCIALPMPALRRPHDRDRGVRVRLRAEVAADAKQDRHVMSQPPASVAAFPFRCAGAVPAPISLDPITSINAPSGRRCAPSPHRDAYRMLPTSPACRHAARILPGSRPPSRSAPASIPIALAAQPVPNFPRLRALALFGRRPLSMRRVSSCRRPKTCTTAVMDGLFNHLVGGGE